MHIEAIKAWSEDLKQVHETLRKKKELDRFDIDKWGARDRYQDKCGFAGCALGWGAHRKVFDRFGWHITLGIKDVPLTGGGTVNVLHRSSPTAKETVVGSEELATFLGITDDAARLIVYGENYDGGSEVTALDVAERLDYLAEHDSDAFVEHYGSCA